MRSKKQEKQSSPSVVADLRNASPPAARFIAETLLQLEVGPTVRMLARCLVPVFALKPEMGHMPEECAAFEERADRGCVGTNGGQRAPLSAL